jgi:hypothetical protein
MANEKHIALIEFAASHVECIYSQLLFLKSGGYTVHLIACNELQSYVEFLHEPLHCKYVDAGVDFRSHWRCVLDTNEYLKRNKIHRVVLNTAEGNHVRDLCLVASPGGLFTGILHHAYKLSRSFTQKLISFRIRKYFVLGDYLLAGLNTQGRVRVASFYPIFFPISNSVEIHKPDDEVWIGIPGELNYLRRDYESLVEAVSRRRSPPNVRYILLGSSKARLMDGARVRDAVHKSGLQCQFVFFDAYIDAPTFYSYLMKCDILLPLIHPGVQLYETYRRFSVSGTYNLAIGLAKPMLMHSSFRGFEDIETTSFFYELDSMAETINSLVRDRSLIETKSKEILRCEKFSFDVQCKRYLDFLEAK